MLPLFLEFCANVWFEKPDYLDLTPAPKPVAFYLIRLIRLIRLYEI